jgi:uncharacterized protein YpmB
MQCQNCGQETNGIKINNKLFCTNCGGPLSVAANVETEPDKESTTHENLSDGAVEAKAEAKIIRPADDVNFKKIIEDEEREIDILEAEEELLDVISEINPEPKEKTKKVEPKKKPGRKKKIPIIKHERKRAGYTLVTGEPDPISEPELPIPHDSLIEEAKEELVTADSSPMEVNFITDREENFPLATTKEESVYKEKVRQKNEALRGFFKSGLVEVSKKKKAIIKNKKKMTLAIVISLIIGVTILAFIGLVLYVNLIGKNPQRAIKKAESKTTFQYNKPEYLPPGYVPSYLTSGSEGTIEYIYVYAPSKQKTISIKVNNDGWTEEKILSQIVANSTDTYIQKKVSETNVWLLGDYGLYFVKNNVLYEIHSSDTISSDELIKIAEGMIK